MSVSNELQRMLSSNERGIFLTKDKKQELQALTEGAFSNIGASIAAISKALTKKMKSIASKSGKALGYAIDKLDIAGFKKSMGVKNIDDIDEKLSLMAVNNPEFYALMHKLMTVTIKAKKTNKELYDALSPIYDTHIDRMVDYYDALLQNSTNDTQSEMYYLLLHDIIPWLDRERNKALISKIRNTTSSFLDKKALRPYVKSTAITTGADKRIMEAIDKIEAKYNKLAIEFDDADVRKLSAKEQDVYRRYMKIIEDKRRETGMTPEKAAKVVEAEADKPAAPMTKQEILQGVDAIKKKLGKNVIEMDVTDLQKLSNEEREIYIQEADGFLEKLKTGEFQTKINSSTHLPEIDMDAIDAQMNLAKTLAAAIQMRGKTFKTADTPSKPAPVEPAKKPLEPAKPNPVTASKKSNEPAAPAAPAKPNPITAGKKI